MIICAAVKIQVEGLDPTTIIPCRRHGDAMMILKDLGYAPKTKYKKLEEGFLTHEGDFMNRKVAFDYALDIGQLNRTTQWYKDDHGDDELYSEDLY